ncbi:class I SAM-dependent methyltransferase [Desulfosarcina sp.]|nr:class I SAM-dependent methyltransferase [Desulfosarcina sp.]
MDEQESYKEYRQRQDFYQSFGVKGDEAYKFIIDHAELYNGTVLEIGTGKGYFTLELARCGLTVMSIDILEESQQKAEALLRYFSLSEDVSFQLEDATRLSFSPHFFDAVVSVYALHHMTHPEDCLKEMIRVVKPSGKIIISDFNENGFLLVDKIHKARGEEGHPVVGIRINEARKFFDKQGFLTRFYSHAINDLIVVEKK